MPTSSKTSRFFSLAFLGMFFLGAHISAFAQSTTTTGTISSPTGLTRTTWGKFFDLGGVGLLAVDIGTNGANAISVPSANTDATFHVFSNIAWRAFSQNSWLTVSDVQPTGLETGIRRTAELKLKVEPNLGTTSRTGTFHVLSDTLPNDFSFKQVFTVTQAAVGANFSTGVASQQSLSPSRVYPNPAQDRLTLQVFAPQTEQANVRIINMLGSVVYQAECSMNVGENYLVLTVSDIPTGMYILETRSANQNQQVRFVKQ